MKSVAVWSGRVGFFCALVIGCLLAPGLDGARAESSSSSSGTLYQEDFEDGLAQGWNLPTGSWEVIRDGGSYVLRGQDHTFAVFGGAGWGDFTLELRLKMIRGALHVNLRTGECQRYFVGVSEESIYLNKTPSCDSHPRLAIHTGTYPAPRWYAVRIICSGSKIDVLVDGAQVITYTDPSPILSGGLSFETLDDSEFYIGGITVGTAQGSPPGTASPSTPTPPTCTFLVSGTSLEFASAGGESTVTVSTRAECAWTASSPCGWVQLNPENNTGPGGVAVTVDANTSGSDRSCTLTIAGQSVGVRQAGDLPPPCTFLVSGTTLEFEPSGGESTVTVSTQAGCAWTASSPCGWVHLNPESNTGPGGVVVTIDANTSGSDRSCTLTIAGQSVGVRQAGELLPPCTFLVSGTTLEFEPSGGESTVTVSTQAGCAWTASSPCGWVHLNPESNTGPGGVVVTIDANTSGSDRSCTLTLAGQSVGVQQDGGRPDLAVTSMDACLETSANDWPNYIGHISVMVKNIGIVASPDCTVAIGLLYETEGAPIAETDRPIPVLDPGDSVTLIVPLDATWHAGMFPVHAAAYPDSTSAVEELDEDNYEEVLLTLTDLCGGSGVPAPDLVVTSIDACLQTTPAEWPAFRVRISATVMNVGPITSPPAEVIFRLQDAGQHAPFAEATQSLPELTSGESAGFDATLDGTWQPGMFPLYASAYADPSSDVYEMNEANNYESIDLKLTDLCP